MVDLNLLNLVCTFFIMISTGLSAYFQYIQFKPVLFLRFIYVRKPLICLELVIQNSSKKPIHICEIIPKKPFEIKIDHYESISTYEPGGMVKLKKPQSKNLGVDIFVEPGKKEIYKIYLSFEDAFSIEPTILIISLRMLASSFTEKHKMIDIKTIIPMLNESRVGPSITKISPA